MQTNPTKHTNFTLHPSLPTTKTPHHTPTPHLDVLEAQNILPADLRAAHHVVGEDGRLHRDVRKGHALQMYV